MTLTTAASRDGAVAQTKIKRFTSRRERFEPIAGEYHHDEHNEHDHVDNDHDDDDDEDDDDEDDRS